MTDDFKLVRCGCGGKAVVIGDADNNIYFVKCDKCWISTNLFHSKAEAITAWNKAMSAKDINVPNEFATDTNVGNKERTAKVGDQIFNHSYPHILGAWMGTCECGELVSYSNKYCHMCGAKLDWGGNDQR